MKLANFVGFVPKRKARRRRISRSEGVDMYVRLVVQKKGG